MDGIEILKDALQALNDIRVEDEDPDIVEWETYESAGILSGNDGLVLTLADGSQYQVTVVQSKRA